MVDVTSVFDGSQTVDESQAVYGSQQKTTESTQEAVNTHLNVGAQAAGVMNYKSSHVTKTEKKVDNVRIPHEKLRN